MSILVGRLDCLINSFRFLGFLLWFVVGPGCLQEGPGGPGKVHGGPSGTSRRPQGHPGPGSKNLKTHACCRALLSGPVDFEAMSSSFSDVGRSRLCFGLDLPGGFLRKNTALAPTVKSSELEDCNPSCAQDDFSFCSWPPRSPRGVPGEGPDYHFLQEIGGFGPIPARIWG